MGISNWIYLSLLMVFTAGCQLPGVKPWQREVLSQPSMQFDTSDLDLVLDDHFYVSKEGTSAGRGFSGGGCN